MQFSFLLALDRLARFRNQITIAGIRLLMRQRRHPLAFIQPLCIEFLTQLLHLIHFHIKSAYTVNEAGYSVLAMAKIEKPMGLSFATETVEGKLLPRYLH